LRLEAGIWKSQDDSKVHYPSEDYSIFFEIEENSFWFAHRNDIIVQSIRNFPPQGTILDVGGGNGFVTKRLQQEGFHSVLIEPGIGGVLNARKRGIKDIIFSTLENAGFLENSVPACCLFDVIEHIPDDESFIRFLHKILISEGKIYITVPAYRFLWSPEDADAGHFRRYTIHSLRKTFQKNGFQIEYATYFFSFLIAPIFLFRTLPGLIFKPKTNNTGKEDHIQKGRKSLMQRIIHYFSLFEYKRVRNKHKCFAGSSIMMVAKKIHQ
jgi:SAM-dependent methyltransferase